MMTPGARSFFAAIVSNRPARRIARVLRRGAAVGLLGIVGCAATDSVTSTAPGTDGGATSGGGNGRLWVLVNGFLHGVDLATGKDVGAPAPVDRDRTRVYTIVPAEDQVWLGRVDGVVAIVDKKTSKATELTIDAVETWGISSIVAAGGSGYVGSGAKPGGAGGESEAPPLVRIDAATLKESARKNVFGDDSNGTFKSMAIDGSSLWVLSETNFQLIEVEAPTMAVRRAIPLSENRADPTGPRVEGYGGGYMAQIGGVLWVMDDTSDHIPLLRVDKSSLQVTYVRNLADEFGPLAKSCLRFAANTDSLFVGFCNAEVTTIARLDGATGATKRTYKSKSDPVVTNHKLYVGSPASLFDVLEIDIETGAERVAYTAPDYISGLAAE